MADITDIQEKKVFVKLHARCLVDSKVREAGEVVEIAEVIADDFGERVNVKTGKPEAPPIEKSPETKK